MVKAHKMAHKSKDDEDGEDVSVLRTPIQLHGKPMEQILNSVHYGTPELRSLLMDECDVIFECKVCRALFRDLANFISHKRRYCTKSFFDDNYLAIAKIPDEKVYVIQPQEPESSKSNECQIKPRPKPSLEETVARLQSGELGHSHAFNVYTEAVNKLQRQKEDMKIATIRTRAIPTNPNAVFMDVNMASVNIHERSAATPSSSSNLNSACNIPSVTRNARERMNENKVKAPVKVRSRILRKDCKNSEELQKLLMKELKEIQNKVKQKSQQNDTSRPFSAKKDVSKIRNDIHVSHKRKLPSMKTLASINVRNDTPDSCLKGHDKQNSETPVTKSELKAKYDKSTSKNQTTESVKTGEEPVQETGEKPVQETGEKPVKEADEKQAKTSIEVQETSRDSKCKQSLSSSRTNYRLRRKSLICNKCHSIFSSRQSLSFHNKIIHSPQKTFFPCLYCPSVFYYFHGVTRHLKLSHSKTKSEVNSLRKQLRAKAYSKVLPEVKEPDAQWRSTGLRKSLRHKQDAFSSQTSPSSTFVLHSMKKFGKKLSAKKDALSMSYNKEESEDLDTDHKKDRNTDILSASPADSKILIIKKETENSPKSCSDSAQQSHSLNWNRQRSHRNELKRLSLSLKQSSPRQNLLHTCKKCHRVFGRMLTLKNHIKVCQGKPTTTPKRGRGRPRKIFPADESHVATTNCETERSQSLTPESRRKTRNIFHNRYPSNPNSHSSSRETVKSEHSSKHENTGLKSSGIIDRTRKTRVDSEYSKVHSSSVPLSSKEKKPLNKSSKGDSKTLTKQAVDDQYSSPKTRAEKKEIIDSTQDRKLLIQKSETSHPPVVLNNIDSKAHLKTKKISSQRSGLTTNSSHTGGENEKESGDQNIDTDSKASDILRNARSVKYSVSSVTPVSESSNSNSKLFSAEINREKRSNSVEKDVRNKISHLVPRSPREISAPFNKDISKSVSAPTILPSKERPRRKRKVPTRNLEAMEMLSKIHNPDKDTPPSKKSLTNEVDSNPPKPSREKQTIDPRQLKSQSLERKEEIRPKTEEDSKDVEVKEGRFIKSRSRMFVLGRNKPRGRKMLRSYDNARVDKLIDIQNSKCLVCGEQCTQLYNLRRHVIRIHLQWSRYQCKLCRFSSFDRSECTTHIVRNHRRVVNIEDAQAVNCFITDLAKQGSRAMNMKKNQTLRDKNRLQSKETNIYARPNVRKMPRLAERTLIHEKARTDSSDSSSSPEKEKSEGLETNSRSVRHQMKTETTTHDVSDHSLKKASLPFNISTRNSPRVFDIRPYKTIESSNSNTQGEVIVLHTRKGMYAKTVPLIPLKEKTEFDDKETNGNNDKFITSKDESGKTLSPNVTPSCVSELEQTIHCQEVKKNLPASVIDSQTVGSQVSSPAPRLSQTVPVSSHSPKGFKISPSYVVIKSTKIPSSGTVNIGSSSTTAAKALNFSDSITKAVTVTAVGRTVHSIFNSGDLSADKFQSQPQATFLDDINSSSVPVSSLSVSPTENITQNTQSTEDN